MARNTLDQKINSLLDEILIVDSMVENATLQAVDALKSRDLKLARQVYTGDKQINQKRFEIENDTIITIATQQPIMAGDLRLIASILEVVAELERMGDYAKGIAHICLLMGTQPPIKPLVDIPRMAEISVDMLHRAVEAFISQDAELAAQIPNEDNKVDYLYQQVYRELVTIMLQDTSTIDRANYLILVAHNLEWLADRVTNICERAIYVATGKLLELAPSDDENLQQIEMTA